MCAIAMCKRQLWGINGPCTQWQLILVTSNDIFFLTKSKTIMQAATLQMAFQGPFLKNLSTIRDAPSQRAQDQYSPHGTARAFRGRKCAAKMYTTWTAATLICLSLLTIKKLLADIVSFGLACRLTLHHQALAKSKVGFLEVVVNQTLYFIQL